MSAICGRRARPSAHALMCRVMAVWMAFFSVAVCAQAPAANGETASETQLDKLVAPIALYPDDLIAIILPSATFPLDIVSAERYLEKRKSNKDLPVNESWDDAIKSLLNYPEVITKMSADLEWTVALGEAVVVDQGAVLDAVQRYRRQVQAAGNLKSDDKQKVVVEDATILIEPTNPQVIYVPQYNPATIVVYGGYSSWGYWPTPYPVYYYPYAPGAAFAAGLIWGAAISAAWRGGHYAAHYGRGGNNITINRNTNINSGNVNIGNGGAGSTLPAQGSNWSSSKKAGQVSGGFGGAAVAPRVGDTNAARNFSGASARPSTQPAARPTTQPTPTARPCSTSSPMC